MEKRNDMYGLLRFMIDIGFDADPKLREKIKSLCELAYQIGRLDALYEASDIVKQMEVQNGKGDYTASTGNRSGEGTGNDGCQEPVI
jgi:hypothetical protein